MRATANLLYEIDKIYQTAKTNMDEYQLVQRKVESERDISWSQWYEVLVRIKNPKCIDEESTTAETTGV